MRRSTTGWPQRRWRIVALALVTALAVSVGGAGVSSAGAAATTTTSASPVSMALDYAVSCQRSDGGFAEKGAASSDSLTAWTIIALASAGQDPSAWKYGRKTDGKTPVEYLASQSAQWDTVPEYARTKLAALASGSNASKFGGVDLIGKIRAEKVDHGSAGDSYGSTVEADIWALIALKAAGETVTPREVSWLLSEQSSDGGWGSTNNTALALQALIACGESSASGDVKEGVEYLRLHQQTDAGFGEANSTAWAIQALQATGHDMGASPWKRGSATPVSALIALQRSGGAFRNVAGGTANLLSTAQAIPPLSVKPFPGAVRGSRSAAAFRGAPVVSLVTPTANSTVLISKSLVLKLSLTDAGTGIDSTTLVVKVDGKSAKATLSGTSVSVGPVSVSKGSHTVTVSVADRAGNAIDKQEFKFKADTVAKAATTVAAGTTTTYSSYAGTRTAGAFKFPGPTSNDPRLSTSTTSEPETTRTVMASERSGKRPGNRPDEPKKESSPIIPLAIGATSALAVVTSGTWWYLRRRKKPSAAS